MRYIGENIRRDSLVKNYIFRAVGAFNIFFAIIGLGALALQSWAFSLFPPEVTGGQGDPVKLAFRIGQLSAIGLLRPTADAVTRKADKTLRLSVRGGDCVPPSHETLLAMDFFT